GTLELADLGLELDAGQLALGGSGQPAALAQPVLLLEQLQADAAEPIQLLVERPPLAQLARREARPDRPAFADARREAGAAHDGAGLEQPGEPAAQLASFAGAVELEG